MRGQRISYSAAEMAWLESNRMLIISDYHRAFVATFGRDDVTALNLHGLRKRKGWFVGRKPGRFFGRHRKFSDAELAWLEENRLLPISEYAAGFHAVFGRDDVHAKILHALRTRKGWKTGRTGQYEPGSVPLNKGKRCPDGKGGRHPNARRTQFKKGNVPHTYLGPGHERIDSKDGYVVMIVDETNPWSGGKTRPVFKHRWLWEQVHGPVPDGMVLKCLDGNKRNVDPSNWKLIPRALLPRLGGRFGRDYDNAPAELKPAILAVAELEHSVREIGKSSR